MSPSPLPPAVRQCPEGSPLPIAPWSEAVYRWNPTANFPMQWGSPQIEPHCPPPHLVTPNPKQQAVRRNLQRILEALETQYGYAT